VNTNHSDIRFHENTPHMNFVLRCAFQASLVLCFSVLLASICAERANAYAGDAAQARATYEAAVADFNRRRFSAFEEKLNALAGHPLAAMLEQRKIRRNFSKYSAEEILAFREAHRPSLFAEQLFNEWLAHLRRRGDWETLARYYEPQRSAEMQCAYLRALYNSGQRDKAFEEVPRLWVVGRSQHEECDPVFDVWLAKKRYTQAEVWDRMSLVHANGQRGLGNYLMRFVAADGKAMAEELARVHQRPSRLSTTSRYARDTLATRRVIMHGLGRMVSSNPETAVSLWKQYKASHDFSDEETERTERALLKELARLDRTSLLAPAKELPDIADAHLFREVVLSMMRQGEWKAAFNRLADASPDLLGIDTWRYWLWLAAEHHRALPPEDRQIAVEAADALAGERGYYGFLMAMRLERPPSYGHQPITLGEAELVRLQAQPAAMRVIDLYYLGEESNARRELAHVSEHLAAADARILLKRVWDMGWISDAMINAMRGRAQDDLDLRFPLAYEHLYRQAATRTGVPLPLLMGLTRQESLFRVNARSSAGARGLMQLMPGTARSVARQLGLSQPRSTDLYQPELNIALGSRYLADRLADGNGNRALAAAAYNGGPGNLRKWLRAYGDQPLDLFIESIRFSETREYVKLVLSFSAIYAWKLELDAPFLNESEIAFGRGLNAGTAIAMRANPQ